MKFYCIYYYNILSHQFKLKKLYNNIVKAQEDLKNIALDYVRDEQGNQQALIAFQDGKDINDIANDAELKAGFYLRIENDVVSLYEKTKIVNTGFLWNSEIFFMQKLAIFNVSDLDLEIKNSCNCSAEISIDKCNHSYDQTNSSFVKELQNLMRSDEKIGLLSIASGMKKCTFKLNRENVSKKATWSQRQKKTENAVNKLIEC